MFIIFLLTLGIIGSRFDYIEIDLLLSLGIIIIIQCSNNTCINWNLLHSFLITMCSFCFIYWLLILITPYDGALYKWLRGYEGLSYFFGLPRINNVCLYYLLFIICSMRMRLASLILVTPMLSIVPYTIIIYRLLLNNIGKTLIIFLIATLTLSSFDLYFMDDFFAAFVDQKSISIKNRMILDFPGLLGTLDNVRISESILIYVAQKYHYYVSISLLISILIILTTLKISRFNSILIIMLININPILFGAMLLFAKIAQERSSYAYSSNGV